MKLRRMIRIPNDEKLIAQLTSRRKLYDSRGREKLESKADLANRGVESPDRADALIGAVMMGPGSDPYVLNPSAHRMYLEMMEELTIRSLEIRGGWIGSNSKRVSPAGASFPGRVGRSRARNRGRYPRTGTAGL
jgi:hypothetical protein